MPDQTITINYDEEALVPVAAIGSLGSTIPAPPFTFNYSNHNFGNSSGYAKQTPDGIIHCVGGVPAATMFLDISSSGLPNYSIQVNVTNIESPVKLTTGTITVKKQDSSTPPNS